MGAYEKYNPISPTDSKTQKMLNFSSVGGNKILGIGGQTGGLLGKNGAGAPQMTEEEKALIRMQAQALYAQQVVTAHQFHYKINDNGSWTKMSDDEWLATASETERKEFDTYQKTLNQYNMALNDELPLSKGMQTQKEQEFTGLKSMGNVTGANLETAQPTDTIGAQRLNLMKQRWEKIKEDQRLSAMGMGATGITTGQNLAGMGTMNPGNIANPNGFNAAMEPYSQYNRAKYDYLAQKQNERMGMVGIGAGLLASMYGGPAAGRAVPYIINNGGNKNDEKKA
jgi:hypothetical protein